MSWQDAKVTYSNSWLISNLFLNTHNQEKIQLREIVGIIYTYNSWETPLSTNSSIYGHHQKHPKIWSVKILEETLVSSSVAIDKKVSTNSKVK